MHFERFRLLPELLLPWYRENRRDLPWRRDREPYHVWLSEIMLQQTRVEAVKGYYIRFLQALPTLKDLSRVDDGALNKLWEGLGYYSRARNLKKAAVEICTNRGGQFPNTYEGVLSLPGVGEYTAGAVCSIAFDLPTPAVDGNVLRLWARLTDDHRCVDDPAYKKEVRSALTEIYPAEAGAFTQALMELGATLCGPNRPPECEKCPCRCLCLGADRGTAEKLPVRAEKKAKKREEMTVFLLEREGDYALNRRPDTGLLAGLWELPHCPGKLSPEEALAYLENQGVRVRDVTRQWEKKHIFTHIIWEMRCYAMTVRSGGEGFTWVSEENVERERALPTAFRQFWEERHHV